MSKKPAPASAVLLLLAAWSAAQDAGILVSFRSPTIFTAAALAPGTVVYDSGESLAVAGAWDTVIFQGVSPDAGVHFEVARRQPGGAWGAWVSATVKRFPNGRFWGKARVGGGGPTVRLRAIVMGVVAAHPVEIYTVEAFLDRVERERGSPRQRARGAAVPPAWWDRASWGAKPPKEPYVTHQPDRLSIHHTAGALPSTPAEAAAEVLFIQDFHQNARGWNDIGYHYLVAADGTLFVGRPEEAVGAHVKDANTGNLGIAFLGNHHPPQNHAVDPRALDAALLLAKYLAARYGIAPDRLKGHRDQRRTLCPGDGLYAHLDELRRRLEPSPRPPQPPLKTPLFP